MALEHRIDLRTEPGIATALVVEEGGPVLGREGQGVVEEGFFGHGGLFVGQVGNLSHSPVRRDRPGGINNLA